MTNIRLDRRTQTLLCYGLYAILSHITSILLYTIFCIENDPLFSMREAVLWVEHTCMSAVILGIGGLLLEKTVRQG